MSKERTVRIANNNALGSPDRRIASLQALLAISVIVLAGIVMPAKASAQTFADVPPSYWAFVFIEGLAESGITGGCGGGNYCPENPVTRAQMAVFLVRGMRGSGFSPPPASGSLFQDVGANDFAAGFIE